MESARRTSREKLVNLTLLDKVNHTRTCVSVAGRIEERLRRAHKYLESEIAETLPVVPAGRCGNLHGTGTDVGHGECGDDTR